MHERGVQLPSGGYAIVVEGELKTRFETRDGAIKGARYLKQRFPSLRISIYEAETNELSAVA
jgi:hypothetical protein